MFEVQYPTTYGLDGEIHRIEITKAFLLSDKTYLIHGKDNGKTVVLHLEEDNIGNFYKIPHENAEYVKLAFKIRKDVTNYIKERLDNQRIGFQNLNWNNNRSKQNVRVAAASPSSPPPPPSSPPEKSNFTLDEYMTGEERDHLLTLLNLLLEKANHLNQKINELLRKTRDMLESKNNLSNFSKDKLEKINEDLQILLTTSDNYDYSKLFIAGSAINQLPPVCNCIKNDIQILNDTRRITKGVRNRIQMEINGFRNNLDSIRNQLNISINHFENVSKFIEFEDKVYNEYGNIPEYFYDVYNHTIFLADNAIFKNEPIDSIIDNALRSYENLKLQQKENDQMQNENMQNINQESIFDKGYEFVDFNENMLNRKVRFIYKIQKYIKAHPDGNETTTNLSIILSEAKSAPFGSINDEYIQLLDNILSHLESPHAMIRDFATKELVQFRDFFIERLYNDNKSSDMPIKK